MTITTVIAWTIQTEFFGWARGDDDLTANGTVLDIGDSGRTVTTDGDDSGGGGCFISILN